MKMTRRILSWVLAIAMVVTCGITGLVLPASADEAVDLLNGQGTFEEGTDYTKTALSGFHYTKGAYAVVDNPAGDGKVLRLGAFVDEDGDGVNDGEYTHTSYPLWKKLYDAEEGTYTKAMQAGKTYTVSFDVYGDAIGYYFDSRYEVLSENAEDRVGGRAGWFKVGGAEAWKTYTFTFYPEDNIADAYHEDWWSWGNSFNKGDNDYSSKLGFTYIDNFTIVETQATSVELDIENVVLEPGDKTEAPVATFAPERTSHADLVYTTNNVAVATVDAATGVITAVGLGSATITATAGELTDTIKVTVQADKTRVDADVNDFTYNTTNGEEWKAGDSAPVLHDEVAGVDYVTVKDAVAGSTSDTKYAVKSPNFISAQKDEWIGITFLARISGDTDEFSGKVRACVRIDGGIANGYHQSEFMLNDAKGWVRHTVYAMSYTTTTTGRLIFYTYGTGVKDVSYTGPQAMDIAGVYVFKPKDGEMNLAGVGGNFEDGNGPTSLGSHDASGLLYSASAYIAPDPVDPTNKALKFDSSISSYYFINPRHYVDTADSNKNKSYQWSANKMYKITFRLYNGGSVTINSYGNKKSTFPLKQGTSSASGAWRTVTIYMQTAASGNNYGSLHLKFGAAGYLDDLQIYEVPNATGFDLSLDDELTIGESTTVSYETVPKHAYPGVVTVALAEGSTGLTLSGSTLKAASTSGVEVSGGTITATSDLLDESGNPISSSRNVKVLYPEEHFVNGTMDTGSLSSLSFTDSSTHEVAGAYKFGEDGVGINGTKGLAIYSTGAKYFKSQTYVMKPNSVYVFQAYARANGTSAKLELNLVTGNNNTGNKIVSVTAAETREGLGTDWVRYAMYVKTGATTTYMDTNWNIYFNVRQLPTVEEGVTPAVYVDNISLQLVSEGDDHFTGLPNGLDFEAAEDEYFRPNTYADVTFAAGEGRNGSGALKVLNSRKGVNYAIKSTPYLNNYAVYKLSFWTRADQQWVDEGGNMYLYWGSNNAPNMHVYGDVQFKDTTAWGYNEFIIVTNGRSNLPTNTFYFATDKTTVGTGALYFDDVKFECIATDNFVSTSQDSTSQEVSVDGGNTWHRYLIDVEPGTTVQVKNWQYSGYVINNPLKYVDRNGVETKILNKKVEGYTEANFGTGDGRIFEFAMPDTSVRVVSSFNKNADKTFNLKTAGASLRYTDTENFDGIRFLTRMTLGVDKVAVKNGEMTLAVKYNGVDYTVVEIGSYLKRYSETESVEDELTVENAKWTSVAYKKGETDMKLLDYTGQYIDFASVMLKGESVELEDFYARKYTARGYIVLEDAEGNQVTVLADGQASASVNEIAPLV